MNKSGMLGTALLLMILVVLSATDAAQARRPTCHTQGTTTLVANEKIRLFGVGDDPANFYVVYGCHLRTRRVTRLGYYDDYEGGMFGFVLSGGFAAYSEDHFHKCEGCGRVHVTSLRTGRTRTLYDPGHSFVLKRNGSVAYLAREQVRKLDRDGFAVLDFGPVEYQSLALGGSRLYWATGGEPRTGLLR